MQEPTHDLRPIDVVREFFPDLDDVILGYLLWNETPYPFGNEQDIRTALVNYCLVAAHRRPAPEEPTDAE